MPVVLAKFDLNRFNESPLRGEKPDFWPVSKFNTGSLPLRGNPADNELNRLLGSFAAGNNNTFNEIAAITDKLRKKDC